VVGSGRDAPGGHLHRSRTDPRRRRCAGPTLGTLMRWLGQDGGRVRLDTFRIVETATADHSTPGAPVMRHRVWRLSIRCCDVGAIGPASWATTSTQTRSR